MNHLFLGARIGGAAAKRLPGATEHEHRHREQRQVD